MEKYDLTIIIPTFNERDNIENIVESVSGVMHDAGIITEVLVVDDNSDDGTIEKVREMQEKYSNLELIVRYDDHGLSQSVTEGFYKAKADIIQVIDADFSHPPKMIPEFYTSVAQDGNDVVIGSRYLKGGDIENWPLKRRLISLGATFFGRILFPEITDPVSGFFAIKRDVIKNAVMKPRGYKILMEVLGKGHWYQAKEIPFVFKDREEGDSKLKLSTIIDYILQCIDIAVYSFKHHETNVWQEWKKIFKFAAVGISGIFVNVGLLYFLTEYFGIFYLISSLIAIETSIITNFILNDLWTFKGNESRFSKKWHRFVSFQFVSVMGVLINMGILWALTEFAGLYYVISNLFGIGAAFAWNFLVNRNITWKKI
ncbi:glycosyltransferase family 2 protein [Methanoplanus sp. FWC-SCC4]|uniref:Glycosyltransferase family 2 protein n=1 Tax=Methanochimaera problematica TaxID=2609417 RepID=A0AA97FFL7_9EURY|nr:glycosyltransferase family 2 protein [Methanoplanus sp. FWC-SCC4]WOF17123.1 glycosyltransferase family 2 protein [Methanoplanus sp. FWC-SCC4]